MKSKFATKLIIAALALMLALPTPSAVVFAQQQQQPPPPPPSTSTPQRERGAATTTTSTTTTTTTAAEPSPTPPARETPQTSPAPSGSERPLPSPTPPSELTAAMQAGRIGDDSEERAAILPYYNNFLTNYRLGPEDVISIVVFNQDRYSRAGIAIPPNGRISHQLIPGGILVVGKTTAELEEELKTRLDEFIIDPIVTVSLDRAASARYFVMGDVRTPGVRPMTRRLSVVEALAEAGGVLETGDRRRVTVLRLQQDGTLSPLIVDVRAIERGRAPNLVYLAPGDYVVVPGNRLKTLNRIIGYLQIVSFARIFASGF